MKILCFVFVLTLAACSKLQVTEFVSSNNDLSINTFYELIKTQENNFVYGIFCLDAIIALICLGSKGDTAKEIKTAFKWKGSDESTTATFKAVVHELKKAHHLNILLANKIFLNHHIKIDHKFLEVANDFNTKLENVNFSTALETSKKINAWVKDQTNQRISDMTHEKHFSATTDIVLVNSLYFRGKWKYAFQVNETKKMDFYVSKNKTVKTDMMKLTGHFLVDRNTNLGIRMLRFPYRNEKAELIIMLPDEVDGLDSIERDARKLWNERNFNLAYVTLYLPKLKMESTIDMIPILKNMGVTKLFSSADLSGITKQNVTVSAVIQKLAIGFDETGTEPDDSLPHVNLEREVFPTPNKEAEIFKADHPFLFAVLYDGLSLLVGRFIDPRSTT